MLASRLGSFDNLRVADLFAGSGALGIEALSRGAGHCLFVDQDAIAVQAIKANLGSLGGLDRAELRVQAVQSLAPPREGFDLVLLDPPYGTGIDQIALDLLCDAKWLTRGGIVAIETDGKALTMPKGFEAEAERRFGKAHLLLLRCALS